jgi:hypothetical protein
MSLRLTRRSAMKAYGGVEIHIFLTSARVGGEWSASRPDRFTSGERAHVTHWIGGWVAPRSRSARYAEVKIRDITGTRTSIPRSSSP